ncbi:MAG: glycosyltransferase family 4 protein [Brevinematia bacterium]
MVEEFKKPKIVVDVQMLSRNELTGMGRYIQELLPHLFKYEEFEWITKKPRSIKGYRTLWEHTILPITSLLEKADVLFSPSNIVPFYLPKKIKLIVTVHDVRVKVFPETFSRSTRMYYDFIYSFLFKRANLIITVSEFSRSEILKYFPEAKNKIYVIPNGINTQKFKFLDLPRKKQILLIGALAKHKNISVVLKAFQKIYNTIPHNLIIVGSKDSGMPQDEEMKQIMRQIPSDRVIFTGRLSDDEVVNLYNESEVFVFPSLYEGFGLPVLEAMACGCPVIASNRASLPEVCGDAAIIFNPDDPDELSEKIFQLVQNDNVKETLRKKGFERIKLFSWESIAKQYIDLIKKVLKHE